MNDAHELNDKARALLEEIGVTRMGKGNGMGMMGGEGIGMGGHRGGRMGGGMMGGNLDN
jgi:hypothetical protein